MVDAWGSFTRMPRASEGDSICGPQLLSGAPTGGAKYLSGKSNHSETKPAQSRLQRLFQM